MRDYHARPAARPRRIEYAYVDSQGERHLPISDGASIRTSIAAFAATPFETQEAREEARRLILRAAGRYGIEVSKDSGIRRRMPNLRRP